LVVLTADDIKFLVYLLIHLTTEPLPKESFRNYLTNYYATNMSPLSTQIQLFIHIGEIMVFFQKYQCHYSIDVNSSTVGDSNAT
jgi:hypothetical protein